MAQKMSVMGYLKKAFPDILKEWKTLSKDEQESLKADAQKEMEICGIEIEVKA